MPPENGRSPEDGPPKLKSFDLAELISSPGSRLQVKTDSDHWYYISADKSGNQNILRVFSKADPELNGYIVINASQSRKVTVKRRLYFFVNRKNEEGRHGVKTVTTTPIIEMVLMKSV